MTTPFRVEALDTHDRTGFACGVAALDEYFRTRVTQDIKRRVANCFVVVEAATGKVAGFYTLSSASVPLNDLPETVVKKLPRYPSIPAARIGRLAIDTSFQGKGLGAAMLADAATKAMQDSAAAFALLVDAKDEKGAQFYEHEGFVRLDASPLTLFLPLETVRRAREAPGR